MTASYFKNGCLCPEAFNQAQKNIASFQQEWADELVRADQDSDETNLYQEFVE